MHLQSSRNCVSSRVKNGGAISTGIVRLHDTTARHPKCHVKSPLINSDSNANQFSSCLPLVRCHAQKTEGPTLPSALNIQNVTSALFTAQKIFEKHDAGKKGSLTLKEATELLNSSELRHAVMTMTNIEPLHRTEDDLRGLFQKADTDHSGTLSKSEFLAMYLSMARERVQGSPLVLAEALLGFIDVDRNGKIEGGELKVLLAMLGFPAALLLPIPKFIGIDYRGVLKQLGGQST